MGALGAFIMVFAFLNGYALLYFDTRSYIRGPLAIEPPPGAITTGLEGPSRR